MNTHDLTTPSEARYRPVLHALAVLTAILTLPLLLSGGTVTVYRVGMAVPDWPTTFGVNMVIYDMLNSPWGVQLEHSHRLLGMLVGIACIIVLVAYLVAEPRRWLKIFAAVLLVAVSLQGYLGGSRVTENSQLLAMIHGCTAQAFFALAVAFAVCGGRSWAPLGSALKVPALGLQTLAGWLIVALQVVFWARAQETLPWLGVLTYAVILLLVFSWSVFLTLQWLDRAWSSQEGRGLATSIRPDTNRLRRRALVTLVLIYVQIVAGAWLRHFGDVRALWLHAFLAITVWGHATVLAIRILKNRKSVPELVPSTWAMLAFTTGQVLLGILSWWMLRPFDGIARPVWPAQAALRVAHQGMGALLLASIVILTLRAYRHLARPEPLKASPRPEPAPLEALA